MSLLPDVLSIQTLENDAVSLALHIPENLHYFPNHFPNAPILPGVVQLNWAIHYGQQHLPIIGSFLMMENIKFQAVVLPKMNMQLTLQWYAEKQHLEFVFADDSVKYSSGRIVFGGQP